MNRSRRDVLKLGAGAALTGLLGPRSTAAPAATPNAELATNGNHLGPSDVGIWYCTYYGDKTYGNRFSIRYAQDVVKGSYGWNIYATGTVLDDEVEVVSPGWGHFARKVPPYVPRLHGDFYRRCWNTVLNNPKAKIVMIVTFNDYLENTAVWTADTTNLTDAERWENPDGELNPSLYWNITVEKIAALRRSTP